MYKCLRRNRASKKTGFPAPLVPLCVRARPEQSVEMSVTDYELQGLGQSAKNAFRAVQDGDLATLKRFLGSVDINIARNTRGRTLLHVACLSDDRLVVAELLRAGADPCACDEVNGSTPLHLTVFKEGSEIVGSVAITRMLLRAGANVNAEDSWGETPLHAAAA